MNPLALHARNYRCFDSLDIDLPDGCVAILGENGAGKSSIVNAIDLAIFGPASRSLAEYLAETAVDEELLLELTLEHAGELYRIRRTFSPRGRGKTTLDFEWWKDYPEHNGDDTGPQWVPRTAASAKETQELIERTIGLTRETFRASAFLAQGDGAAFTDAQPRDRKRILADVLGLDRYDRLAAAAKRERTGLQEQHLTLTGRLRLAEETIAGKRDVEADARGCVDAIVEARDQVADLEREHAALAERFQAARDQQARRQAAAVQVQSQRLELERLMQADARATDAAAQITITREELETLTTAGQLDDLVGREAMLVALEQSYRDALTERDAKVAAARAATNEQNHLIEQARELEANASRLLGEIQAVQAGELEHCPTCAQLLGADARAATIANLNERVAGVDANAKALRTKAAAIVIPTVPADPEPPIVDGDTVANHLVGVRGRIRIARAEQAQRARLEERIVQLQTVVSARPAAETLKQAHATLTEGERALAELAPVDVDEITRQGTLVKQRLEAARATLQQQQTLKARLDERLAQVAAAEQQHAAAAAERARLDERIGVYLALEKAFGRDGIPALILENAAIPAIETEANRILDRLGTSYRVELRTQAELRSGDGLRDTLDVVVQTEHGSRAYETFSGGEKTRLNLALRIALARLLAHRRGAESRLLVVDEPDGLDEAGMAALVDVLRGLEGDFAKLYVVSHVPGLRDSFDTTLTVRDGVLVDSLLETVPA